MLASRPLVRVALHAQAHTPYEPTAVRALRSPVVVELTNTGEDAVPLGTVWLTYAATRDGVTFPCVAGPGAADGARAPASLRPHQSIAFERQVDCTLTLPGVYEIQAFMGNGSDEATREPIGRFPLTVDATNRAPQRLQARPGLFATMTGATVTAPLSPAAWARGDYHVVVVIINGGRVPVRVGGAHLALVVNKRGSPLPCAGESQRITFPDPIGPGATATATAPLVCAPSVEGDYEIIGRLGLDDAKEETDIGRLGLTVTRDPLRIVPVPWPLILGRP
jgi:hypothetical protein